MSNGGVGSSIESPRSLWVGNYYPDIRKFTRNSERRPSWASLFPCARNVFRSPAKSHALFAGKMEIQPLNTRTKRLKRSYGTGWLRTTKPWVIKLADLSAVFRIPYITCIWTFRMLWQLGRTHLLSPGATEIVHSQHHCIWEHAQHDKQTG